MFAKNAVHIDKEKCVGCALCVKDCPNGCLYIEEKKAVMRKEGCIECGHCFAICPSHAVSMKHFDTSDCEETGSMSELDSDKLLLGMKSRRTVRHFKEQPVEQEKIDKILEAGRYSPTGANSQKIAYIVLGSRQDEIEQDCLKIFHRVQKKAAPFVKAVRHIEADENFFFKKAPLVIAVTGTNEVDAALASSYMEIMAESMGLGVLYSGFFRICTRISLKIRRKLNLPNGYKVITCMVIGYPDVKYQRTAPRKPVQFHKL